MKQHFMTHKLRGDPGYEDADESQCASTPDSVASATKDSPKDNDVELQEIEINKQIGSEKSSYEDTKGLLNTYQPMSHELQLNNSPNGKHKHFPFEHMVFYLCILYSC